MLETDVLIIGGGLAAIKACFECGRSGRRTILAVQERLCSGSSFYPLTPALGCLAPRLDDPGDAAVFMQEINEASQGMNDPLLGRIYIDEIHDRVAELPDMGIDVSLQHQNRIACFAKRERALYVWRDWTQTRRRIRFALQAFANVQILEKTAVLDLLKVDGQVAGAVVVSGKNEEPITIQAGAVILATGGFGALYKHSLNTADVDGSGLAMAYQAGAGLTNLEFIQFIPGFLRPRYKVLFGELCLPFCSGLFAADGREILSPILPENVIPEQVFSTRGRHGPFTVSDGSQYFDIAIMNEIRKTGRDDAVEIRFDRRIMEQKNDANSGYLTWMSEKMKIDLINDRLSIAPFAQASNGGIVIDPDGWTGVPGLYAAGEAAGSMHGADRIGGCAAGNCLVFGYRAAHGALRWIMSNQEKMPVTEVSRQTRERWLADNEKPSPSPAAVMQTIQTVLWNQASIIRSGSGLTEAEHELGSLHDQFHTGTCLQRGSGLKETIRATQSLLLAERLIDAMQQRKESRGAHYRSDYPGTDPGQNRRIIQQMTGREQPVTG